MSWTSLVGAKVPIANILKDEGLNTRIILEFRAVFLGGWNLRSGPSEKLEMTVFLLLLGCLELDMSWK